jgi:hypothetical protein
VEIKLSPSSRMISIPRISGELSSRFQVGQVLAAAVLEKLSDDTFLLQLTESGQKLRAETAIDLEAGQDLKLEVIKTGGAAELRVLSADSRSQALADVEQRAYRLLLPRQQNLSVLVEQLLRSINLDESRLPEAVAKAIRALLSVLPGEAAGITPERMKQAILGSGIFLDAMLEQSPEQRSEIVSHDLKGKLLMLFDALKSVPPAQGSPADAAAGSSDGQGGDASATMPRPRIEEAERGLKDLLKKTEGALAKIMLDQLASLPQNDGQQAWRLEIPLSAGAHGEFVRLGIREERSADVNDGTASGWSVLLELNPPGLGEIQCRINVVGDRIDAFFFSQEALTADLILVNLNLLESRLRQAGLAPTQLDAQVGSFRKSARDPLPETLVDERA